MTDGCKGFFALNPYSGEPFYTVICDLMKIFCVNKTIRGSDFEKYLLTVLMTKNTLHVHIMFFYDIFMYGISQNKCDYFNFERLTSVQIIHGIFCEKLLTKAFTHMCIYSYLQILMHSRETQIIRIMVIESLSISQ